MESGRKNLGGESSDLWGQEGHIVPTGLARNVISAGTL